MKIIKRNFTLKMLALALSFISCLAVHILTAPAKEDTVAHRVYTLPIKFVSPGGNLVYASDVKEVVVTLRGSLSLLDRISPGLVSAEVNLSGRTKPGNNLESVEVVAPGGVSVSSVDPAYIWVKVSQQLVKEVPVQIALRGQVGSGFSVGTPVIEPDKLRIVGADDQVEQVAALRAPLAVANASETFSAVVRTLIPVDIDGKEVAGITPASVPVSATVPVYALRRVPVDLKDIRVKAAKPNQKYLISVEPETVLFECSTKDAAPEKVYTSSRIIEFAGREVVETVPLVYPSIVKPAVGVSSNVVVKVSPVGPVSAVKQDKRG